MRKKFFSIITVLSLVMGFSSMVFATVPLDNWVVATNGTTERFLAVATNWPMCSAYGNRGEVWYSDDEGYTWQSNYYNPVSGSVLDGVISPLNSEEVVVGTSGLIAYRQLVNWQIVPAVTPNSLYVISCVYYAGGGCNFFITAGDGGVVLASTDLVNWNVAQAGNTRIMGLDANDQGQAVCANVNGAIYSSNDYGQTWTYSSTLSNIAVTSVKVADGVWLVGGRDNNNGGVTTIWRSTDRVNWTQQSLPYKLGYVHDIDHTGSDFVATASNTVISSPDGITWTLRFTAPNVLYGIKSSMMNIVAVGPGGLICHN